MRTEGVAVQRNRPSKPQSVFLAVASVRDKRSDVPGSDARDSIDGPASHSRFPTKINWMGQKWWAGKKRLQTTEPLPRSFKRDLQGNHLVRILMFKRLINGAPAQLSPFLRLTFNYSARSLPKAFRVKNIVFSLHKYYYNKI